MFLWVWFVYFKMIMKGKAKALKSTRESEGVHAGIFSSLSTGCFHNRKNPSILQLACCYLETFQNGSFLFLRRKVPAIFLFATGFPSQADRSHQQSRTTARLPRTISGRHRAKQRGERIDGPWGDKKTNNSPKKYEDACSITASHVGLTDLLMKQCFSPIARRAPLATCLRAALEIRLKL